MTRYRFYDQGINMNLCQCQRSHDGARREEPQLVPPRLTHDGVSRPDQAQNFLKRLNQYHREWWARREGKP